MTTVRRWRLATAAAFLALLFAPVAPGGIGPRALAHAQLVASSPGAGSVVADAPAEIRLVFSEPVESGLSSLDLATRDGTVVVSRAGSVDPSDPYALVLAPPALADGVYSITWRSVSAADGHTEQGFFTFGIGDVTSGLPQVATGSAHGSTDPIGVLGRWLAYLGLFSAIGLALFNRAVIRTGPMPRRLVRLVAAGLAVSSAATLVMAVASAIEAGSLGGYLFGSRNGLLQVARAAVADAGAIALLLAPRRLAAPIAGGTGLVGIGLLVTAGHAAALPGPAPLAGAFVHVLAAGLWLGGLGALLLLLVRPELVVEGRPPPMRVVVPRFSAVALVSIGLVAVTGAYTAWSETGSLLPAGTEYGRTLVLKSALAIGAIGLGALNYFDGGRMKPWLDGMRTRLGVEGMTAGAVLLMAAALATTPPVDRVEGIALEPVPDAFGQLAPDVEMHLVPGRPGVNRVVVTTTDALVSLDLSLTLDRLDGGTSTRVPLVASGLQGMAGMPMDPAAMAAGNPDGTLDWFADAVVLPAGSSWDTAVVALSSNGTQLSRQRFAFTMSAEGVADGRIRHLVTPGSLIALALVVGGALGLGLGLGGMPLPRCEGLASRVALLGGGAIAVVLGALIGGQLLLSG